MAVTGKKDAGASGSAGAKVGGAGAGRYWRRTLDSDTVKIPHGEITVIETRCKGCGFCAEFCPRDVLVMSARFNPKGYHPPDIVARDLCVACHLCELLCPEFAIFVREASPSAAAAAGEVEPLRAPAKKALA